MRPTDHEVGLTGTLLERILEYNPSTGIFYHKITRGGALAGSKTGMLRKDGYAQVKINGRWFLSHRLAWVWMNGKWPPEDMDIDHINRNKSDNRISNLRLATRSKNCINAGVKSHNKSGYTGVFWNVRKDGRSPRWLAYITVNRKRIKLGLFERKQDAIRARAEGEKKYFGEFARKS